MAQNKDEIRQQGVLPFELQEIKGDWRVTSFAGLPLVAEAFRASGGASAIRQGPQSRLRHRERGLSDEELAESFCLLLAAGGDHIEDFEALGDDEGLAEMVGHAMPSVTRAKEYLYAFDDAMAQQEQEASSGQGRLLGGGVGQESGPLAGLGAALDATVRAAQLSRPQREATIDLDATIVVSEKREAQMTYTGERGYQPVVAYWAEQEMVVADEFRDGDVPAGKDPLRVLRRAVEALPQGVEKIYLRADSAAYEHELLNWCRDEAGITFAISADMSQELRRAIEALPHEAWSFLEVKGDAARSWAEVEFVPSGPSVKKGRRPDRYLALRIEPVQRELFADGTRVKHFALVTNDWERPGPELLEWQRQKAGTVEKLHDVLKNDLGAGGMPCARFGANAAWVRLNALTFNLLSLLRQLALPPELRKAEPKRLRFHVLCLAGQIIAHARRLTIRVGETLGSLEVFRRGREIILRLLNTRRPAVAG